MRKGCLRWGENFNLAVYAIVARLNYKNRTFIYQLIYRES